MYIAPSKSVANVSRETLATINRFLENLSRWSKKHALVSNAQQQTLSSQVDSSLVMGDFLYGNALHIGDIGSGNGFPGVVIAAMHPQHTVHLIEANHKKAAFLIEAARHTQVNAIVHPDRAETVVSVTPLPILTAKAFASLPTFFALLQPPPRVSTLLSKGAQIDQETTALKTTWTFTQIEHIPDATGSFIVWTRGGSNEHRQQGSDASRSGGKRRN